MKKSRLVIFLAVVLSMLTVAGCSASTGSKTADLNSKPQATYAASATDAGVPNSDAAKSNGAGESLPGGTAIDRKIIRNASMSLEAKDVEVSYNAILAFAAQFGGYEAQRTMTRTTGFVTINAQIKILPGHLDELIQFAGTQAEVINSNISSENITEAYYDAQTRLQSMEKSLVKYYEFLTQAKSIDETLKVQSEINQLTLQIESLKGKIKVWDSLLAESVLSLQMRQTTDPVKIKKDINWSALSFGDMGYLIGSGFTQIGNFLIGAGQWIVIAVAATSPVWIIGLSAVLVLRSRKKKRIRAAAAAPLQVETPPQETKE